MTFKKIIGKIHLWLGLSSGLVVFIISITGCIYAFQAEISEWTQPFRRVTQQREAVLPPTVLRAIAEKELPGKKIHAVQYERGGDRAVVVSFFDIDPAYYYLVYVNPYSGEVLKVKNMDDDFFSFILQGHYYLWLPESIGQTIAASATLVFVVMLISGMVLWWPRKKKVKQRLSVKWNARWRRKNYDLHNVLGFYVMGFALILALTGLVWGFQWFGKSVYQIAGGDKSYLFEEPYSRQETASALANPVDKLWLKMKSENAHAEVMDVHFPTSDSSAIEIAINPDASTHWKGDYRFFDQYTLAEIPVNQIYGRFDQASAADKLIRMNYDIHTGAVWGIAGKVLAFFASLICASLPVTGFYIWYGRKFKKKEDSDPSDRKVVVTEKRPTSITERKKPYAGRSPQKKETRL